MMVVIGKDKILEDHHLAIQNIVKELSEGLNT